MAIETIAKTIRELRIKNCMTQEKLAVSLSISPQAVSKWETGQSLPDLAMLPELAKRLGVTIDYLFSPSPDENKMSPEMIIKEAQNMGDNEAERLLRESLAIYKNDYRLMDVLIQLLGKKNGNDDTELFRVGERILCGCTDDKIRFNTIRAMAFACKRRGDLPGARELIGRYPESICGEDLLSVIETGIDKMKLKELIISRSMLRLYLALWVLSTDTKRQDLRATQRFIKLVSAIFDGASFGPWHMNISRLAVHEAKIAVSRDQDDKAISLICLAYEHAEAHDAWVGGEPGQGLEHLDYTSTCFMLTDIHDFQDSNDNPCAIKLINDDLAHEEFDEIRPKIEKLLNREQTKA